MQAHSHSALWRFTSILVLIMLVFAPLSSFTADAASLSQEAGPQSVNAPGDHLVTNISLGPDTPNILRTNQDVTINFSYSTTQVGGVRIFVHPYTNGAPSANYAVSGSPLYPQSATGTGSGTITITAGTIVVDEINLHMTDANQTVVLFDAFIPVYYLFSDAGSVVSNIGYRLDTPNVSSFNQHVDLTFDYITRQQGGVLIFARPFTNGALTPNYAASGSPTYTLSSGSGTGFFTITSQQAVVDQIRVQMWNLNQTVLLFEAFLPVYYRFYDPTNIVTSIGMAPDTPNIFKYSQNINFTFNYTTNQVGGVVIFLRPFSGAHLSPSYAAHGSGIYPVGSGGGTGYFSLTAGPTIVDKVRIQMWDAKQTTLLFEAFLPVSLFWAGSGPPPGPDMHVDAIEVTQAIQDLNNSVDLIAGKKTYARVHVSAPVNVANVYATLSGQRGFVSLNPILSPGNPGSMITVRTAPDRGQLNDSFWFELPSGWTDAGSLTLTARLDPNNAKNDLVQANNVRSVTVNFLATPPLRLRLVDVQYTSGGSTYLAASSNLDALESWLRRAYPISSLQVTRQNLIYPTAGLPDVDALHSWLALTKLLRIIFSSEDPRVVYYGVVDDGGGFMRGKAAGIPSTIAAGPSGSNTWGWDFDGSYADWYGGHEIGHTRGRSHAEFCGATGGLPYPYPNGRISPSLTGSTAIYGFDITTHAIYDPNWKDVMTYCSNEWVSDFTYEGIRSYLASVGDVSLAPAQVTATDFLAVVGTADLSNHTASLENVYQLSQSNTISLPVAGDWTIALVGAGDADLATYSFAPNELTDGGGGSGIPAVIAEIVPWAVGTTRVEIRFNGQVVATRSASAHAPTVTMTAPANNTPIPAGSFQVSWNGSDQDSDPLSYSLMYSSDNGVSWQTLAADLTGTSVSLDTSQLPGGAGQLRIIASDGFLTGQDTHTGLGIPLHAPTVEIQTPNPNEVFYPTQMVSLQGSAYDLEDGTLGDAALSWSSSLDGFLGTGASLNTSELSTGTHVITLLATDSNGMTSQAQRTITISVESAPVAVNMELSPFSAGVVVPFHSPAVQEPLTVRSLSDTELDWTASEAIPWLSLDKVSGTSPSDLVMTIDPTGLSVGMHSGTITFTSPTALNSPQVVTVNLQVTGNVVYLPGVRR